MKYIAADAPITFEGIVMAMINNGTLYPENVSHVLQGVCFLLARISLLWLIRDFLLVTMLN